MISSDNGRTRLTIDYSLSETPTSQQCSTLPYFGEGRVTRWKAGEERRSALSPDLPTGGDIRHLQLWQELLQELRFVGSEIAPRLVA